MDREKARAIQVSEYRQYLDLCLRKGESIADFPVTDDEIKEMTDSDLVSLIRRLKDLARTPTS